MAENAAPVMPAGDTSDVESVVPSEGTEYYGGVFWNSYTEVIRHMNRRVSGDAEVDAWDWFHQTTGRTFRKALVINCGSGWVERALVERGIVESAVGVDISPELIDTARKEAGDLPIRYEVGDTNRAEFPDDGFDLVVNHAAFHHVAYLDRVLRRCCELLPADGILLNNDYVGPHRNQYDHDAWSQVDRVNKQLPESMRHQLVYPHLPTMLVADPTEAVHSELTLDVTRRYFELAQYRSIGGAVAYPLLTHNMAMWSAEETERSHWVARILEEDERWTGGDLFAVYFGSPRKLVLEDRATLDQWRDEEEERERVGAANDGKYHDLTLLQALTQQLSDAEVARDHLRLTLDDLHARLDAVMADNEQLKSMTATRAVSAVLRRRSPRLHAKIRSLVRRTGSE